MGSVHPFDRRHRAREDREAARRKPAGRTSASLPSPECVFLAWRMWLPDGADVAAAARREIARIERNAPLCANLMRLRTLFLEAVAANER